ncbi:MAG: DUF3500 domain-containing protein [Verrucomicrobiales bacterium]|nr:DUF3500 domain-containing protein [Verrucomicrobiales bacterium]
MRLQILLIRLVVAAASGTLLFGAEPDSTASAARAAKAAQTFLGTLDETARSRAVFPFGDAAQRTNWSNLPTGIYQRAGIRFGALNDQQRTAALATLKAALSPQGYDKVLEIMTADQVLTDTSGSPKGLIFGTNEFYISFVGTPSPTQPWLLQFGGHHLALNLTLAGTNAVLTPSLTATQPASYTRGGKTYRPLGMENDLAFRFINSLDPSQKAVAILGERFHDLVLGPGRDGIKLAPEGIPASRLNAAQRALLLDLASQWIRIGPEPQATAKLAEVSRHFDETYFVWSGPTAPGSAAYFRIQGPTLVIEYAPQNLGGSAVNHIHTIYRDPTNEYGKQFATP